MTWKHVPYAMRANIYLRLGMVCGQRCREAETRGDGDLRAAERVYAAAHAAIDALQDIAYVPLDKDPSA